MKQLFASLLLVVSATALLSPPAYAGTDEYLGDASIYAGVPTTLTRPNVLFIIDNSRATLHTAAGQAYIPWKYATDGTKTANVYAQKLGCTKDASGNVIVTTDPSVGIWSEDPQNGCYLPWNIYFQDNQGDFAKKTLSNSNSALSLLTCDPSTDDSKPLHTVFQTYGSYSGSGVAPFPNINSDGSCDWSSNNSSGMVYALGNYLNYTQNAEGDDRIGAPDPGDGTVVDPEDPCANLPPADVVSVSFTEQYCTNKTKTLEECNPSQIATRTRVGYFQCMQTHIASAENHPQTGATGSTFWNDMGATAPAGSSPTEWVSGHEYVKPVCETDTDTGTDPGTGEVPTASNATQREIIYGALEKVIGVTAGVVNFGAISYGGNNSGGKLLFDMADLSANVANADISTSPTGGKVFAPDCSAQPNLPMCQFLNAIPGPGEGDGEPVLSSNTIRPQAESLLDAGYYYGAQYAPVTIGSRIPDAMKNVCGLNHVILITNGFSNGDGSPRLSVVGDADGDQYDNEEVYGLGSHWLDDVAKYLQVNLGVTTHAVLAFQTADELVMNAAKDGEGDFYNVFNAEELSAALLKLLSNILNEANTSFVAPVVPSSTTNRTISSNRVYLGLFRPQASEPWNGNIKKYGLDFSTLQITDANGNPATDNYGVLEDDSISFWSLLPNGTIPTATNDSGYIDSTNTDPNKPNGDGGEVTSGGTGGVLLEKMKGLVAAIKSQGTWSPSGVSWRNIYTYLGTTNSEVSTASKNLYDAQNRFWPENSNITSDTLNLYDNTVTPPVLKAPERKNNLIRFIHGFVDDEDQTLAMTPATAEIRKWVMGDVLHSEPVVFNYTRYPSLYENVCHDFSDPTDENSNSTIIFAGANDGMLHAFRDCDGQELWAFIPPNTLSALQYIKDPQWGHATFVDSAPLMLIHDMNKNGTIEPANGDKVVLIFGQRRGGGTNLLDETTPRGAYYALDVTTPLLPKLLWEFDSDDLNEIGETWSQPRLGRIPVDGNSYKVVIFVGAGYDNNEDLRFGDTQSFPDANGVDINLAGTGGEVDGSGAPQTSSGELAADDRFAPRGRGILAIEVATLSRTEATAPYTAQLATEAQAFWSYTFENNNQLKYPFASDLKVLDLNGDRYSDVIYVGDTGGNLWKFDISGTDKSQWSGQVLFKSNPGADSSNGRKIFYQPEVVFADGAPHIYFGTGDREHPLNRAVTDRMYCVIDWGDQGTYPITESSLIDATINILQDAATTKEEADALLAQMLSSPSVPYQENGVNKFTYGWYVKLDGTDRTGDINVTDPGEKIVAAPTVINGEVYFSTYQLLTGDRSGCEAGNIGIARRYLMDYRTAEAVKNYDLSNDLASGTEYYNDDGSAAVNERAIAGKDGEITERSDRVSTLGRGMSPGNTTLVDAKGDRFNLNPPPPDPIPGVSTTPLEDLGGDPKTTIPVYWMQW